MLRTLALAGALLCALAVNAKADCIPTGELSCSTETNFLKGVRSIKVRMHKERRTYRRRLKTELYGISRPIRYIAGRLICAINVNLALAERGIKGTGSALAHSFDRWGIRIAYPVPGAVAVTDRRGGGHVALVSRVEGSRVFAWNPSPRGRGWEEVEYTNRRARYRVAGSIR